MTPEAIEQRSIIISIVASATFGVLGIIISLASNSGAVFLDGLFSLTFAVVGMLSLYVSRLVARPSDDTYPFGYAMFEPMLNLFKGSLIGFALVYAVWTAIRSILTGGQEIAAEGGVAYAAIAVIGGAAVVFVLKRYAKTSGSPIVEVDAKNWTVDTLISSAVGIAFVATLLLQESSWSSFVPYADPVIMLAIAAIAAPQPFHTVRENLRQLVGKAPPKEVQETVVELVERAIVDFPHVETHFRIVDIGRYLHTSVYVILPPEESTQTDVRQHDRVRSRIYESLNGEYKYLSLDVEFTTDRAWALNSVPSETSQTVVTTEQDAETESK